MKNILIIIAVVAIVGALAYSFNRNEGGQGTDTSRVRPIDEKLEVGNGYGTPVRGVNGLYVDYSPELLANADTGDVVLFFHAGWCPTCKALDRNLISELSDFPEDLTVLKLNYDKESELKKKYGIFIQHTLVQVDSKGDEITKWTGGNDLDSILSRLQ